MNSQTSSPSADERREAFDTIYAAAAPLRAEIANARLVCDDLYDQLQAARRARQSADRREAHASIAYQHSRKMLDTAILKHTQEISKY